LPITVVGEGDAGDTLTDGYFGIFHVCDSFEDDWEIRHVLQLVEEFPCERCCCGRRCESETGSVDPGAVGWGIDRPDYCFTTGFLGPVENVLVEALVVLGVKLRRRVRFLESGILLGG
jgi:hypothetical protein